MSKLILVSEDALRKVLNALVNEPHQIRELQVTREPVALFKDNPINILIEQFNNPVEPDKPVAAGAITDSDRLVFMLTCNRKVVVEYLPGDGYEVYVEQGFMGDFQYPAISFKGDRWENDSDEAYDLKRKAIDAAIATHRGATQAPGDE